VGANDGPTIHAAPPRIVSKLETIFEPGAPRQDAVSLHTRTADE
jgi:hypothetical protein